MTNNKFINAEIPIANAEEAELAAKKAEELGYRIENILQKYKGCDKYLTLTNKGYYGFWTFKEGMPVTPLSDFLNQSRTKTITLENGEKWRVKLIEKVQEEPMTAVEFLAEKYNYITWMRNRDEISAATADEWRAKYLKEAKEMEVQQAKKQQQTFKIWQILLNSTNLRERMNPLLVLCIVGSTCLSSSLKDLKKH